MLPRALLSARRDEEGTTGSEHRTGEYEVALEQSTQDIPDLIEELEKHDQA